MFKPKQNVLRIGFQLYIDIVNRIEVLHELRLLNLNIIIIKLFSNCILYLFIILCI